MDDDVVFLGAGEPAPPRAAPRRKRKAPSTSLVDLTWGEPLPARASGTASTSASAAAGLAAAARAAGTAMPGAVAQGLAAAQEQALEHSEEDEPQQGRKKRKPRAPKAPSEKKARTPKAPKAPVEKRGARYSARPSQQVQDRIARALPGSGHRMFLIESTPGTGTGMDRSHKFVVLGATGNAYNVTIACKPTCSCPDAAKGNVCKHILFVMLRVLRLKRDDPLVWQKALLSTEVEELLSGARAQNTAGLQDIVAEEAVRRAYAAKAKAAAGGASGSADAADGGRRRPIEGEDCPICYEELKAVGEALVWCTTCGNNLHSGCFSKWAAAKRSSHNPVTCVCCRTPWPEEGGAKVASGSSYVNLADVSTAHRAGTDLRSLYGSSAVWIQRNQGLLSTGEAARLWRGA